MFINSLNNTPSHYISASPNSNSGETEATSANQDDLQKLHNINNTASGGSTSAKQDTLDQHQQQQVQSLSARDREVHAHEAAHKAAGGNLTGAISYTYTQGPDGKRYATGGEVSVDTSEVQGDPEATIRKAEQIRAAALAPAAPSNHDRAVALQAAHMLAKAQAQIMSQQDQVLHSALSDSDMDAENAIQENSPKDNDSTRAAKLNPLNANKIATYNAISNSAQQHGDNINLLV